LATKRKFVFNTTIIRRTNFIVFTGVYNNLVFCAKDNDFTGVISFRFHRSLTRSDIYYNKLVTTMRNENTSTPLLFDFTFTNVSEEKKYPYFA